jgi:hypothetical protein
LQGGVWGMCLAGKWHGQDQNSPLKGLFWGDFEG